MKTKTYKIYYIFLSTLWLIVSYNQPTWAQEVLNPAPTKETADDSNTIPSPQTSSAQRIEPNPRASLLTDLSQTQQDPDTEIIQLGSDEDKFAAFYKQSSTAVIHGGAIIFPDDRTHPNWPIITNPLRVGLSNYGWATLALSLPQSSTNANPIRTLPSLKVIRDKTAASEPTPIASPSESTTPTSQGPNAETSSAPENYKLIMRRGAAAIQALQQKGMKRFIIIGAGTGATWATALATNLQDQADIKLIIINAQQSQDISAPTLLDLIPELKTTSLDIYSAPPGHATKPNKQASRLRIETARRNNLSNYHQSRLPQITNTLSGQEWLLRYTRGLLITYVIKAEEKAIKTPSKPTPSINQKPGATQAQKQTPI
ncbi:MAG: DUF3530 family protein [Pseudomonadales bacterium]